MDLVRLSLSGLCSELLGYVERAFRQEITLTSLYISTFSFLVALFLVLIAHLTLQQKLYTTWNGIVLPVLPSMV